MRPRNVRAMLAGMLAIAMAVAAIAQPAAISAQTTGQATSPQTAGSSTVSFGDDWVFDEESSDAETVFLAHQSLTATAYIYGELQDPAITTPEQAIDEFADGFFGAFGDSAPTVATSGTIAASGTAWRLYSVVLNGIPFGVLVTGNVTAVPGSVVVNLLLSPEGSFDLALGAAQQDIDVNGAGSPLAGLDAVQLTAALEGQLVPATETATEASGGLTLPPLGGTTPEAGATEAPGGLTLPPLGGTTPEAGATTPPATGQTVTVSGATLTYGGNWAYEPANSTPDELAFFSNATAPTTIFGYATVADSSGNAALSLQQFNEGFFGSFGATNVQQVTAEVLPTGAAWTLNTADQGATPIVVLAYADVASAPGQFRAQILIADATNFDAALADTQASMQIDGVFAFDGLDAAAISALLGGGAVTGATTPAPGGLSLPPLGGATGQTVAVGSATVGYSEAWTYDPSIGTEGESAFFSSVANPGAIVAYAWVAEQSVDALGSLQEFNDGFFSSFGATNVLLIAEETLPSGHAWSLYTASQGGAPIVVLSYADVTTVPGEFRVQLAIVPAASFQAVVTEAQQGLAVDGIAAFAELDAAQLGALLGG